MTIDERLQALAQTVELFAGLQRDREIAESKSWAKFDRSIAKLEEEQAKTAKMLRGFGRYAMAIAHDHENHLHQHEKRIFDLENDED